MERQPDNPEGGKSERYRPKYAELQPLPYPRSVSFEFGYLSPIPPEGDSWDEWVIERGIAAALRDGRGIDNRTARAIASQMHEGQSSALYSLASTGAVDEPRIYRELARGSRDLSEDGQSWVRWLFGYCALRIRTAPVEGWNELAIARDRADLELVRRNEIVAELDDLFGQQPDEQIGSVDELGWFGLARHHVRPGGLVLNQNEQGFRGVWITDSAGQLEARWAAIEEDYDRFYRRRDKET